MQNLISNNFTIMTSTVTFSISAELECAKIGGLYHINIVAVCVYIIPTYIGILCVTIGSYYQSFL